MASASLVITKGDVPTPSVNGIFAGLSFFLVQRLPIRSSFVERIQTNGGRVVKLETQADHVIADHYRQDCPPGSISYTFIDTAIKNGQLPDPASHPAGPARGTVRAAGSGVPGRNTRTPFTAEDDRVLYQWVERARRDGGRVKGNEIYKQLEAVNPRHTYQAWRDRYVKRLMDDPPAGVELAVTANAPPSPPRAQDAEDAIPRPNDQQKTNMSSEITATAEPVDVEEAEEGHSLQDDMQALVKEGGDIEMIAEDRVDDAWNTFAENCDWHTADEWRRIWLEKARPVYLAKLAQEGHAQRGEITQEAVEGLDGTNEAVPRPSSSPKRKRGTRNPDKVYGRKKSKHDADEIFGAPDEEVVANEQSTAARYIPTKATTAVVNTSDLNAEAQAQFDEEVLGIPRAITTLAAAVPLESSTSDLNQAAEQQLQQEALELAEASAGSIQALTEANLATQQAEHTNMSRRGQDIAVDDDESDGERQDQFVEYLQALQGQSGHLQDANAGHFDLPSAERELHLSPNVHQTHMDTPKNAFATEAHFSSEAVVEEVLNDDELINWPNSPLQDDREEMEAPGKPPHFSHFESQVIYPSLQHHVQESSLSGVGAAKAPMYPNLSQTSTRKAGGNNNKPSQTRQESSQVADEQEELEYSVPRPAGAPISSGVEQQNAEVISSDSSSNVSEDEAPAAQEERRHVQQQKRRTIETQDIISAETQIPDFEMPLPPDSDDMSDELQSDPLEPGSSPPPQSSKNLESQHKLANTQTLADDEEFNDYVETMKVRGFDESSIINALKATSTRPDLAELVLLEETAGKGLPNDVPGIWSEAEDKMVEGGNANALQRLEAKHGWEECEARLEFLNAYRDDEEEEE